jgi:hypothetical protein
MEKHSNQAIRTSVVLIFLLSTICGNKSSFYCGVVLFEDGKQIMEELIVNLFLCRFVTCFFPSEGDIELVPRRGSELYADTCGVCSNASVCWLAQP